MSGGLTSGSEKFRRKEKLDNYCNIKLNQILYKEAIEHEPNMNLQSEQQHRTENNISPEEDRNLGPGTSSAKTSSKTPVSD